MVDRIKQIMEYYELSPASFAEQIGINRSNLTHLFSGRNQPSLELAKKILNSYPNIKTEWLIMGVGEMFRGFEDKELEIKRLNEKKQQKELSEPDLFAIFPPNINTAPVQPTEIELIEVIKNENREEIKEEKRVEKIEREKTTTKIVFFYSDNSFEIFHPE